MATKVTVKYKINSLDVTIESGDQLTFRHTARRHDFYLLIMLSPFEAMLYNPRERFIMEPGIFDVTWDQHVPTMPDPENPGEVIPDPDGEVRYTTDIKNIISEITPGSSIKKFIRDGWRFEDFNDVAQIVNNEDEPQPEE